MATDRPQLLSESLYAHRTEKPFNDAPYFDNNYPETVWHKLLLSMGVENPGLLNTGYGFSDCRYDSALTILQQIRQELGESSSYEKLWAKNQDAVFSSCDNRKRDAVIPKAIDVSEKLPKRAGSDFLYQLASWHFYRHEYDKALALYQQVEHDTKAPLQAFAAYMTLRCLKNMAHADEAYEKIDQIQANPTLKSVHDIAANYKFIIMNSNGWTHTYITPELATKHFRWLMTIINVSPLNSTDLRLAIHDYFDALEQLDRFFPLYHPESQSVDWWLTDESIGVSTRMQAVKALASNNEIVDWLQAKWAYNVFNHDWLWALHQNDAAYWQQNKNIVEHAWQRWQQNQAGEWLQIAIQRVHPNDPRAQAVIKIASPYLTKQWQGETKEYREWLFELWKHLIRLQLGLKHYSDVIALIEQYPNFREVFPTKRISMDYYEYASSLEQGLRWLVYTGEIDQARRLLSAILKQYPYGFRNWRVLLAANWPETVATYYDAKEFSGYFSEYIGNRDDLWQYMVNLLPANQFFSLASDPHLPEIYKAYLARAALTRAFLLNADDGLIDRFAVLVAKYHPAIREPLLTSISQHQSSDYVDFMLRMPRFRPIPFTMELALSTPETLDLTAIDVYNHKDNNWWCQFDSEALENKVYQAAKIIPYSDKIFLADENSDELAPFINRQKDFLMHHPYHQLIDKDEINKLEAIPDAPEYLTQSVIAREIDLPIKWVFWLSEASKNQHAANLHRAIRTTRYGCVGHAASSQRAFNILHKQYGNTIWAKATPYWFEHGGANSRKSMFLKSIRCKQKNCQKSVN
ncbi:hypothetical protein VZ94_06275 [Methylocucumis oryzae]|uniref:Uncharacterized protein n=1 Tax=Methylocucumis oryzae TaxID=1632867 RepID=A0A0F3IKF2_9GAMM|nr:hypothetical protein VZ94_06275 [Methylocucumis oryzae]